MSKKKGHTVVKSKKKMAVARATVRKGNGRITINKRPIEFIEPEPLRMMVEEPLALSGESAKGLDITVTVNGGGFVSQAIAARSAIAKAIVDFRHNDTLRKKLMAYDRMLLVDNPRRVESKKPLGPKARTKKQQSKR